MRRFVMILLLLPMMIAAQEKKNIKPGWKTITAAGFAAGQSGTGAVFQISSGVTFNRYYAGIGAGYDRYEFDSWPVFADMRASFGNRKLLFVYVLPGYTIPGKFTREMDFEWRKVNERMEGGFYMDMGFGYRIPMGSMNRLSFSAGYIRKSLVHRKMYSYPCGTQPCTEAEPDRYVTRYDFGLITTKLSWELGR